MPASVEGLEIRLLGPCQVRRADGSLVTSREWRTGKTLDLLRLLALESGHPIRVSSLLEQLWPDVSETKGRASLRTAASQLRRTLQTNCIERRFDGLVLRGAWVDTQVFTTLAAESRSCALDDQPTRSLSLALEAESLYLGDFTAHDDDSVWAMQARRSLSQRRLRLLLDAAETAHQLGWMRNAIELAERVIEIDPCSEQAHRTLMLAYASIGRTETALRGFEQLRLTLADELGADPSAQTHTAHLQVLTGEMPTRGEWNYVGREEDLAAAVDVLDGADGTASTVVMLRGERGSGRQALVREACRRAGVEIGADATLLDPIDTVTAEALAPLCETVQGIADDRPRLVLVPVSPEVATHVTGAHTSHPAGSSVTLEVVEVGRMSPEELTELAEHLLAGAPSPDLMSELAARSGGLAGPAVEMLRSWATQGRLRWSHDGLALGHDLATAARREARPVLRSAMEQLNPVETDLMHAVALAGRSVDATTLNPLFETLSVPTLAAMLDRLVDLRLLRVDESGYTFDDPAVRDAVEEWLRPSARRYLHCRLAELSGLPASSRILHWLSGGEPRRACQTALASIDTARGRGQLEYAREQLDLLRTMLASLDLQDEERDRLDALVAEADDAVTTPPNPAPIAAAPPAATTPSSSGLAAVLIAEPVTGRDVAPAPRPLVNPVHRAALVRCQEPGHDCDDAAVGLAGPVDEQQLWHQLDLADRDGRGCAQFWTRIAICEQIALPQRQLDTIRRLTAEAIEVATTPGQRAQALLMRHLPEVLLSDSTDAREPLRVASTEAASSGSAGTALAGDSTGPAVDATHTLQGRIVAARTLVAHQFGLDELDALMEQLAQPQSAQNASIAAAVRIRVLTERSHLAEALAVADEHPVDRDAPSMIWQYRVLAEAILREALGEVEAAVSLLRQGVDDAMEHNCRLQLPELVGRLIRLEAEFDLEAALGHFELFDWATAGETPTAVETWIRQLARASIRRANGHSRLAADSLAIAAEVAEQHGLPLLAAQAHLLCAEQTRRLGGDSESRLAVAAAVRCMKTAGAHKGALRLERTSPQLVRAG